MFFCLTSIPLLAACPAPAEGDDPAPASTSGEDESSGTTGSGPASESSTAAVDPDDGSTSSMTTTGGEEESTGTTSGAFDDPGCPECIVLANGLVSGRGIAVDVDHVYWTDQGAGTVHRILKGGGEGGVLAAGQDDPYGIAVSEGLVYWTNFDYADGGVLSVPATGGEPTLLSEDEYPRSIVVHGDQVYWGTFDDYEGRVMRVPVGPGQDPVTLAVVEGGVADLAVDGDQVFFTAHTAAGGGGFIENPDEPAEGSVFVTSPGTDPFNATLLAPDLAAPWGIALWEDRVVWVDGTGDGDSLPRSVLSMPRAGGEIQTHASGQTAPWDVRVDEQYAYWTDDDQVWAVPLEGGDPIMLAEQQDRARSIVVDEQWVFWVTRDRLLQRPKP